MKVKGNVYYKDNTDWTPDVSERDAWYKKVNEFVKKFNVRGLRTPREKRRVQEMNFNTGEFRAQF